MYRGLLKTVARVWKPNEIRDATVLEKVLTSMQSAAHKAWATRRDPRCKARAETMARALQGTWQPEPRCACQPSLALDEDDHEQIRRIFPPPFSRIPLKN